MIKVSAPCKVHLLGEWSVVWGKPALLAAVDLRMTATISPISHSGGRRPIESNDLKKIIEPIVKKHLKIKKLPPYQIEIKSEAPIGAGLGSSAAVSASYIAALLSFLGVKWDLNLVNQLSYEAEKVFHGNPSGADNSTIVYGGLIWFRKETEDLRIIQPLDIKFSRSKNFVLIHTGTPKETTKDMVMKVKSLYKKRPKVVEKFLEDQEKLVRQLLPAIKNANEKELIRIIREGEKNLESIGVVSKSVVSMIRQIEKSGGAAKISGAGGKKGPAGTVLAYHPNKNKLLTLVKSYNLPYFTPELGVEGLRKE